MAEFQAQLELGARNFHPKPCMFTWAKIGSTREVAVYSFQKYPAKWQLSFNIYIAQGLSVEPCVPWAM